MYTEQTDLTLPSHAPVGRKKPSHLCNCYHQMESPHFNNLTCSYTNILK